MREEILENLKSLEKEEQIGILYACESGSSAWGFSSADSDYEKSESNFSLLNPFFLKVLNGEVWKLTNQCSDPNASAD